jgi:hypothetical protein
MRRLAIVCAGSILLAGLIGLSGCGTYTPDIQEFWGTSGDTDDKLKLIVRQVECELRRAAQLAISSDLKLANDSSQGRKLKFLEDWGADANFIFTVEEKSALTPSVGFNSLLPNVVAKFAGGLTTTTAQSYSTTIGAQLSSDGYRQDKVHVFFKLADLIGPEDKLGTYADIYARKCVTGENATGTVFLESDLKLYEWLRAVTNLQYREEAHYEIPDSFATSSGVISHEVKFEIVSSGNVTPMWKLALVSANTGSSPLFMASRDRTQDLIITLGPQSNGQLKTPGLNAAFASELAAAIRSAFTTPPQ